MKNKKLFSISLAFCLLGCSFASIGLSRNNQTNIAKAEAEIVDCGSTTFTYTSSNGASGFYADGTDSFPALGWHTDITELDGPCFKNNGTPFSCFLKKISEHNFYVCLFDVGASGVVDEVLTIEGKFHYFNEEENKDYQFEVLKSEFVFDGTNWSGKLPEIEFEEYADVSIRDLGCGDFPVGSEINTEANPTVNNTFVPAVAGTEKPYVKLSFDLKMAEPITGDTFDVRIGSSTGWDAGNIYRFMFNASWGASGVASMVKFANGAQTWKAPDGSINLKDGLKHRIEIGIIGVEDSTEVYIYVKFDNSIACSSFVEEHPNWSTKVGFYYAGSNLELTDVNSGVRSGSNGTLSIGNDNGNANGIYLAANQENSAAYDSAHWTTRFYSDKENNILLNGTPLATPSRKLLVKYTSHNYYVCLGDYGISAATGDILTVQGGWHGVDDEGNKVIISFAPRSFVFDGSKWGYSTAGYSKDNVTAFVNTYLHMDKNVEGQCITYYEDAMNALNALTEEERIIFATSEEYSAAYLRLQAWAVAMGESLTIDTSLGKVNANSNQTMNLVNNSSSTIIIILTISAIGVLAISMLLLKKKHNR